MAGFVAMVAVLAVVAVEQFFASKGAGHTHDYGIIGEDAEQEGNGRLLEGGEQGMNGGKEGGLSRRSMSANRYKLTGLGQGDPFSDDAAVDVHRGRIDAQGRSSSFRDGDGKNAKQEHGDNEDDEDLELDELESDTKPSEAPMNGTNHLTLPSQASTPHPRSSHAPQAPETSASEQKELLQCLLLEAGILFHSIFIGMALSVAVGSTFIVLLVAISFHQTFEGLALGARISAVKAFNAPSPSARRNRFKPWLMALAYGTTTPAGQLLGLVMHNLYDPASEMGLLMVGVTNAVSSGLLLFAGLVQLLAEDFLSDKSYVELKGGKRIQACLAVVLGACCMAFVGAFA